MPARCCGPNEAWLLLRGLKTLPLRMRRQCANALAWSRGAWPSIPASPASTIPACRATRSTRSRGAMLRPAATGRCSASSCATPARPRSSGSWRPPAVPAGADPGRHLHAALYPAIASHRALSPEPARRGRHRRRAGAPVDRHRGGRGHHRRPRRRAISAATFVGGKGASLARLAAAACAARLSYHHGGLSPLCGRERATGHPGGLGGDADEPHARRGTRSASCSRARDAGRDRHGIRPAYADSGRSRPSRCARRPPPRTCPRCRSPASRRPTSTCAATRRCWRRSSAAGPRSGPRGRSATAPGMASPPRMSAWRSWSRSWSPPTRPGSCSPPTR